MYKKLFIPGPTHVRDEILQAQLENKDKQLKLVDQLVDDIKLR